MKDWKFIFEKQVLRKHRPDPAPESKVVTESKVVKVFRELSGDCFVDIGSNGGMYSMLAEERFGTVYSIDPNPKWNAPCQYAVSDTTGVADFYIGDNNGGADSLVRDPHILGVDWKNGRTILRVATFTFDDLGIDADLVKVDVEGAEFQVLAGMKRRLPKHVIIELHDERRENELVVTMAGKGYHVRRIDRTHWFFTRGARSLVVIPR